LWVKHPDTKSNGLTSKTLHKTMKKTAIIATLMMVLGCQRMGLNPDASNPTYDFTAVDNLLEQNVANVYKGKVMCIAAKNGKVVYKKSIGGYTETTRALLASVTKSFSAAVILSLVDDKKLSLDDSIGKFLPIFTKYGKGKPTIRQCFSHSSGFEGSEDENLLASRTLSLAETVDNIAKTQPLKTAPGSSFDYGGLSMHIVGRIAEVVSGKSWNILFQERIADKCELKNTVYLLSSATNPRISGGLYGSAGDIMNFATMIQNKGLFNGKRVLSEAVCEEFWKDQTNEAKIVYSPYPMNPKNNNPYKAAIIRYSIGCWLDVQNPQTKYVEQISGIGAFGTYFWIDRVNNITAVCFTESQYATTFPVTMQVIDLLRNKLK
jgi:CubicO group peptidase (beta-lactamase class C family)